MANDEVPLYKRAQAMYIYRNLKTTSRHVVFSGIEIWNFEKVGLPTYHVNRRYLIKLNPEPIEYLEHIQTSI